MKHAFLIIAHSDPEMLQTLVSAIDSEDADIFVHWDRKSGELPVLKCYASDIIFLSDRVDVRWGDTSQMLCEYKLMERAASQKGYDYYHIISGSHYPLRPMDGYFADRPSAVFSPMETGEDEINLKIRRISLFTKTFKHKNLPVELLSQKLWTGVHKIQKILRFRRYADLKFIKASNWCSLSSEAVAYLLGNKARILKKYRHTFCVDEYFAPSELAASSLGGKICWTDNYLYVDFAETPNPRYLGVEDYDAMIASGCLWARKFRSSDSEILKMLR